MKCYLIIFFVTSAVFFYTQAITQTIRPDLKENPHSAGGAVNPASSNYSFTGHARLFFPKGEELVILKKAKTNVLLSQLIQVLKKEADKDLAQPLQLFTPDAELLKISREQIKRLVELCMAYRLFKEKKYAKKAEEEILNVCKFPSWHPEHFLDVAEMTTAVAIGYDWCYDYLSEATRKAAEEAILQKGFTPAWPIYESTDKKTPFNRENNWNMVCNSGMVSGAIAIGDKYPSEAKRVIDYAVKYTPNLLESFAPEGVFNEGPGYWSYNGMYMALLFDNLERNVRNSFGLPDFKGLGNTAHFYAGIIGPTKQVFNFGDAPAHIDYSGTFFLLSKQYHQPEVAEFYRNLLQSALMEYKRAGAFEFPRFFFLSIPWFDDARPAKAAIEKRFETYNGVTDFIIINGKRKSDTNRLYLAAKTGKPSWSHNQLDVGSFVIDCDGERWGIDLGADSYSLPNFWDYKPGGVRWNYFRNTNLAHNTLSIDKRITNSDGQGELIKADGTNAKPYGIFDITAGYEGQASSVKRGFRLLDDNAVLIRDEITLAAESKGISWRFLTSAAVKIEGNTAVLSQNGKRFYVHCLAADGIMTAFAAKPNSPAEKPVKGVTIIEIALSPSERSAAIPVLIGNDIDKLKRLDKDNLTLEGWR